MTMRMTAKQLAYAKKVGADSFYATVGLNASMPNLYPIEKPESFKLNVDWDAHFRRTDITKANVDLLDKTCNSGYSEAYTNYYSKIMAPQTKEESTEDEAARQFITALGLDVDELLKPFEQ